MRKDDKDPPGPASLKVLSGGEAAAEEEKKDREGGKGSENTDTRQGEGGDHTEQQVPGGTYFKDPDGERASG